MIIKKFEVPTEKPIFTRLFNKLDNVRAKNKFRAICWEIRRLEDSLLLNGSDEYKVAVRKNLNYLRSQRKKVLEYLN